MRERRASGAGRDRLRPAVSAVVDTVTETLGIETVKSDRAEAGMTVLFLAPGFPPNGESGVYRTLGFVKYLGPLGWRSVVVTLRADCHPVLDYQLVREIPEGVPVLRTHLPGLSRVFRQWAEASAVTPGTARAKIAAFWKRLLRRANVLLIPDTHVLWLPYALAACVRLARKCAPRVLVASAPPSSVLVIGALASRLLRIPLVLDFRDAWTVEPYYRDPQQRRNRLRYWMEGRLETWVFRCAASVICQQDVMARDYARQYPQWRSKITTLNNGFDEDHFRGVHAYAFDRPTLLYIGYVEDRRNPSSFLSALKLLKETEPSALVGYQVLFVGRVRPDYRRVVKEFGLQDLVRFQDQVDHGVAVSMMVGATALLLLTGNNASELPGKLFEYIGAQRPIFAVADPNGEAAKIIEAAGPCAVIARHDPDEIARRLSEFLCSLRSGTRSFGERDLAPFTRRQRTAQLARLLQEAVANDGRGTAATPGE